MRWTPYDRKGLGYGQTDNPTWPGNKTGTNFPYDNSDEEKELNKEVGDNEEISVATLVSVRKKTKNSNPHKRSNYLPPDRGSMGKTPTLARYSIQDAFYRMDKIINEMYLFELQNLKMGTHMYPADPIKLKRAVIGSIRIGAPVGDLNEPEIDPDDLIFTIKDLIKSSDEKEDPEVY